MELSFISTFVEEFEKYRLAMQVICPYCRKEMKVSEAELAEHGNTMVCPQCLMQFDVQGNEDALAELNRRRQENTSPLSGPKPMNSDKVYSYCPHCGKKLTDSNFTYCPYCGNQLHGRAYRNPEPVPPPLPDDVPEELPQVDDMRMNDFSFIHAYPYSQGEKHGSMHLESKRERILRRLAYALIVLLIVIIVFVYRYLSDHGFLTEQM